MQAQVSDAQVLESVSCQLTRDAYEGRRSANCAQKQQTLVSRLKKCLPPGGD